MDVVVAQGVGVCDREGVDAELLREGGEAEVDVLAWCVGF